MRFSCLVAVVILLISGVAGGAETTVFSENFESGTPPGWSLSGDWQVGNPAGGVGPASAYQGSRCAGTNILGYYSNNSVSYMVTSAMLLPASANQITLRYYQWYTTESGYDLMYVDVSTNGGSSWSILQSATSGSSTAWTQRTFDLTSYKNTSLRLRFRFASDGSSTYAGWYVDSVTVVATMVDSINIPHIAVAPASFMIRPGDTAVKMLTICNTGIRDTLQYSLNISNLSGKRILIWKYGADTVRRFPNIISSIVSLIPTAAITSTATTDPAALSALLQDEDVFLITESYNPVPATNIGTAFAPVLDTFVRSGGIVIVSAPYADASFLTAAGLDNISYYSSSGSGTVTVTSPAHRIFDSVATSSLQMLSGTAYWSSLSTATRLATYNGYTVCSEQAKGSGYIYMLGYSFYAANTDTWGRILANCIVQNTGGGTGGLVTADSASGSVMHGFCKNVPLAFHRQGLQPGYTIVQLMIYHNALLDPGPVSVPCTLFVDSTELPHIALAPRSIRIGPADTTVRTLTVCNAGTRDTLKYSINTDCTILAWTWGAEMTYEYPNMVSAIRQRIPSAQISSTATTDPAVLTALLRNTDVFLIPAQESATPSSAVGAAFAPVLNSWIGAGGIVIVLAPNYEATFLRYSGLDTLSYYSYTTSTGYTITINNPTHAVFDSMTPSPLQTIYRTGYWTGTASAAVLATYSGYAVCTEKLKGSGAVYLIGYDFYYANTTTWGRMLVNCVKKGFSSGLVTAAAPSDNVPPKDCRDVTVTVHREGLLPGTYDFQLSVMHNAPLDQNPLFVPCTLVVDSTTMAYQAPSMAVALFTGDSAVRTISIQNTGSSRLTIDVTKTGGDTTAEYISASIGSFTINAGRSSEIRFSYNAGSLLTGGLFIDTFQISENSKNIASPITVICTLAVFSNIPVCIPVQPDPTVDRRPALTWHPVTSASVYTVEVSQSSTFSSLQVMQQTADTSFTPLVNFALGYNYWRVRCDLNPRPSLPDNFYVQNDSIPLLIPIVPDTLGIQTSTLFKWHPSTAGITYRIQLYRVDTTVPQPVAISYVTDTFYTHSVTMRNGKYMWTVSADFDYSRTAYPDTFWVGGAPVIYSGERCLLPAAYGLKAHTAAGHLRILCAIPRQSCGGKVTVAMFDIRGKLIRAVFNGMLTAGYHQFPVSVENIATGVYYCRMRAGNQQTMTSIYLKK